jgi:hypothetical protein
MESNEVYSGNEFNELYPNTKFYKLLNEDLLDNNFQYNEGLNVYTNYFSPYIFSDDGLYFTERDCIACFIEDKKYIYEVIIPDDAKVCIGLNNFKTDKMIISEPILLSEWEGWNDTDFLKKAFKQNSNVVYISIKNHELFLKELSQEYSD